MIEEILLFGAVLLAIGLVFASTLRTATPPLPTSPSVRKTLLAMLPSQVDGPVYELGSGWGGLARTLARGAIRRFRSGGSRSRCCRGRCPAFY